MIHEYQIEFRLTHKSFFSRGGAEARRGSLSTVDDSPKRDSSHLRAQIASGYFPRASAPPREIVALLLLVALSASALTAAEPLPIGLVNVDRILKSHKPLLEKLDPLKEEAKDLDAKIQVRQAELEAVGLQFRNVQPGTPDHQRLQLQLVKMQTDLQQFVASERQILQKKDAMIFLAFFRQLDVEIAKYAKAHDLRLVIRQHETSLDESQPLADIYKALNRVILFEDGLDITDEILKALSSPPPGVVR